jgi:hypothetical protein
LNRWDMMCFHRRCCFVTKFKGSPAESMGYNAPPQNMLLLCCYLTVLTSFKGGPVESVGHNVQNMLLAAFAIVINTMFKAGPFREEHNVLPQNMLLVFSIPTMCQDTYITRRRMCTSASLAGLLWDAYGTIRTHSNSDQRQFMQLHLKRS